MNSLHVSSLTVISPVISQQQFALFTGVTVDTVRGWVEGGTIPTVKIGKQRFINVEKLRDDLAGKTIFARGDYND